MRIAKNARLGALTGGVLLLAGLSAQAQSPASGLNFAKPDNDVCSEATPGVGGAFNLQAYTQGSGFDPAKALYSFEAGRQVYGALMRYDAAIGAFEPWYARSLEANEAGDEWTLRLPEDASYSDGEKLTGAAVEKHLKRFLNPGSPNIYSTMVRTIQHIQVVDDHTVVFKLDAPWGSFPWLLSQPPGQIVNPKVLDSIDPKDLAASPPPEAGLGAFTFVEWTPNRNMVLKAKTDWWRGKICIDTVNVTWNAAGQAGYEAMLAGQVDYFRTWDSPALAQATGNQDVRLYSAPWVASTYEFNHNSAAVKDAVVRQALQRQVNGAVINQRIWGGLGSPSHKLAPPGSPIVPEVDALDYDADAARELVAKAEQGGWGKKFALTINSVPGNVNQGVLQQAMAKTVGIEMVRDEMPIGEWMQKVRIQRNFDSAMGAISADEACPWCMLTLYHSTNPDNFTSFADPGVDAALDRLRSARGQANLRAAMTDLQEAWNDTIPAVVSGWLANAHVVSGRVRGVLFGTVGNEVYVERAYIVR